MSQAQRQKQPLDVLQSMINGILIEVGRALRASDKEGGRTLASANTRLKSFFPGAIDNFHQALDDLECDIVRAKAVFLRDLEDLRAQRLALENPPTEEVHGDAATSSSPTAVEVPGNAMMEIDQATPQPTIKEENTTPQIQDPGPTTDKLINSIDEPKETISKVEDSPKGLQGPSPPSSLTDTNSKPNPVGLDIDTTITTDDAAPTTAGPPDSPIDSLFEMPENSNNGGSEMNFDLEFLQDSNTNGHDPSQPDFDLSGFGNDSQEFNIQDLHHSTENDTNAIGNKQDDLFNMGNNSGGDDLMDLDPEPGVAGGDQSTFADMFYGIDDGNTGGGMENDEFDDLFFDLK